MTVRSDHNGTAHIRRITLTLSPISTEMGSCSQVYYLDMYAPGRLSLSTSMGCKMSTDQDAVAVLFGWVGNHISDIMLAVHHSLYGLLIKGDEHNTAVHCGVWRPLPFHLWVN